MSTPLNELRQEALEMLQRVTDSEALVSWRSNYLGRRAPWASSSGLSAVSTRKSARLLANR